MRLDVTLESGPIVCASRGTAVRRATTVDRFKRPYSNLASPADITLTALCYEFIPQRFSVPRLPATPASGHSSAAVANNIIVLDRSATGSIVMPGIQTMPASRSPGSRRCRQRSISNFPCAAPLHVALLIQRNGDAGLLMASRGAMSVPLLAKQHHRTLVK